LKSDQQGNPIEDAIINLEQVSYPQGHYSFDLPAGLYHYHISRQGFEDVVSQVHLTQETLLEVIMLADNVGFGDASAHNIKVFPNPSAGIFYFPSGIKISAIQVSDIQGRIIFESDYMLDSRLDLSRLHPGIYLLRVKSGKDISIHRIQIIK
jgi:hypothetical protein